jgi:nucleotide-binding universal stress UspA family protein
LVAALDVRGTMFDTILVPTDGSECAEVALGHAEDLAVRYDATVHVISVVDARTLDGAPHLDEIRAERTAMVEAVCERLAGADVPVEDAVLTGVPHREILDYAASRDVDLVAMGSHGRTGVERYLMGSVAEKVVRLSDAPVLTVRAEDDGPVTYPYAEVLTPTDGSEQAGVAAELGIDLAARYGARLHALSVVDTAVWGGNVRPSEFLDSVDGAAQTAVERVADAARGAVPAVSTAVERGHPYEVINSYVRANDVDIVVMGTHGRSGLERYLLGSITEKVVRTSPVPVLTVRSSGSN